MWLSVLCGLNAPPIYPSDVMMHVTAEDVSERDVLPGTPISCKGFGINDGEGGEGGGGGLKTRKS